MNDVCIPIPRLAAEQAAMVEVTVAGERKKFNYRLESFEWQAATSQAVGSASNVLRLKSQIESYDKSWELIQIYNPGPRDSHIHVLFRQRV